MDKQTVLKIAKLARLKIADADADKHAASLSGIFKWIEQLSQVDTTGVEPMTSTIQQSAYRRPDAVTDGHRQAEIVQNAPDSAEGFFVVPKVVE